MCGIAGYWGGVRAEAAGATLRGMTDAIRHRGPDDAGVWHDDAHGVALGHRRLSILDLSPAGHQPMTSRTGRYVVVFNGEIYNFREIRDELVATGVSFRGHSDTEVMLAAFEAWGLDATLKRLAGMFALALWDSADAVLHLTRDRMGEKPLHYALLGDTLLFGSELSALRAHPAWRGGLDPVGLGLFLRHGYVQAPYSIHPNTHKVRPGHVVTLRGTTVVRDHAYWSLADVARAGLASPMRTKPEEIVDELDALLRRVVRDEMVSDVPLGAFLSGGVDSSLIVALMQSQSARPVRSFTISFDDPRFDEAEFAKAVAAHVGTDHVETPLQADDALALARRVPEFYDEPLGDSSQMPTLLLSSVTRRHVTVALSGDGGDELFGGYPQYQRQDNLWETVRRVPAGLRPAAAGLLDFVPASAADSLVRRAAARSGPWNGKSSIRRARRLLRAGNARHAYEDLLSKWPEPSSLAEVQASRDTWDLVWLDEAPTVAARMLADQQSYLPDDILVKVDRAAMASSLETRAPLLDHRVVEFAWRVPLDVRIRGGVGKWPLKQLLYRYVPRELVDRPKRGFAIPLGAWLRGPLRDWGEELLRKERLAELGLRARPIHETWSAHVAGRYEAAHRLWPILMLSGWHRTLHH